MTHLVSYAHLATLAKWIFRHSSDGKVSLGQITCVARRASPLVGMVSQEVAEASPFGRGVTEGDGEGKDADGETQARR